MNSKGALYYFNSFPFCFILLLVPVCYICGLQLLFFLSFITLLQSEKMLGNNGCFTLRTERRRSLRQQNLSPDGLHLNLPTEKQVALAEAREEDNCRPPPGQFRSHDMLYVK